LIFIVKRCSIYKLYDLNIEKLFSINNETSEKNKLLDILINNFEYCEDSNKINMIILEYIISNKNNKYYLEKIINYCSMDNIHIMLFIGEKIEDIYAAFFNNQLIRGSINYELIAYLLSLNIPPCNMLLENYVKTFYRCNNQKYLDILKKIITKYREYNLKITYDNYNCLITNNSTILDFLIEYNIYPEEYTINEIINSFKKMKRFTKTIKGQNYIRNFLLKVFEYATDDDLEKLIIDKERYPYAYENVPDIHNNDVIINIIIQTNKVKTLNKIIELYKIEIKKEQISKYIENIPGTDELKLLLKYI
jgi:hypothetical protein